MVEKMTRRGFMAGVGAATAVVGSGWTPAGILAPDPAGAAGPRPPGFPAHLPLHKRRFECWSGETAVDAVWTASPRTPGDVVRVVNWARANGYQVRPRGYMHTWAPYTVTNEQVDSAVVLLDTTRGLTGMRMARGARGVTVQTGATMESLLAFLQARGKGILSVPAIGEITVGGALAIDGHGACTPAVGEELPEGGSYGSVSNLILSLTAVVWDPARERYVLRTFSRSDPEAKALLTHLGRTFITEVTLQVAPLQHVRCQSFTDITNDTLFAPPDRAGSNSFSAFLDRTGRVEAILYPYAPKGWLKAWSVAPTKPAASRRTRGPYPYVFSDALPEVVSDLVDPIIRGQVQATPTFGQIQYEVTVAGLAALGATDLWGPANHTQHYIKATTLRYTANGAVVLVRRADVQRAVSDFYAELQSRLAQHRDLGRFPLNGPVEIRTSGLDRADEVLLPGAESPALSALAPRRDHPEWDTAIWFNMLTFSGTPHANQLYAEMEEWARTHFATYGCPRLEWSKGWAYTAAGPWTDAHAIDHQIPDAFRVARSADEDWDWVRATFNALDPHRIFANPFLDRLLP